MRPDAPPWPGFGQPCFAFPQGLTYNCSSDPLFRPIGGRMFGKLGLPELLLIMAIALLIFGPGKLAELGKGMGEGIKGFKAALKDDEKAPEKKE